IVPENAVQFDGDTVIGDVDPVISTDKYVLGNNAISAGIRMEIFLVAVCIVGEFEIVSLYFLIVGPVEVHVIRSEAHTSELTSLMSISYAVFCLNKTII